VILMLEREEEELNVAITKVVAEDRSDSLATTQKRQTFERDYKATRRLFDSSNSVSEEQVWEKELNFKTADAEQLRSVMTKKKEWLEHEMAKAQLEKRILRAPFDGVVVKHRKKLAESVQALEPLVDVVDVRRCRFTTYVVAQDAQGFRLGQTVSLQLDGARQPRLRKGKITFVSPVVDKASMLRTIKVVFENADGSIEPGVTGRILP
jgi:multidrug efflux pump subunit AcrA (membrane-fusion protein)